MSTNGCKMQEKHLCVAGPYNEMSYCSALLALFGKGRPYYMYMHKKMSSSIIAG